MLHPEDHFIYLNNAATTWPKPPEVLSAVQKVLSQPFCSAGRGLSLSDTDYLSEGRKVISSFFGEKSPEHILYSLNATDALNTLIHGYIAAQKEKIHVLTTTLEHNSVLRPLYYLEQKGKISLDYISFSDAKIDPESVKEAITPDTRLMVMTHGNNVLGCVQDIRAIGEYLHEKDIFFIVDGAQTAGHTPIHLANTELDAYVFTGHKGLFGMPGIGGFVIRDPGSVVPVRMGGTGTDSQTLDHPGVLPERYEIGTQNYPGVASLIAGIQFIESIGIETIAKKAERQIKFLLDEISSEPAITVYNTEPDLPIVSFNISGMNNDDVGRILAKEYHILGRTGLHCAPLVHQVIDDGAGCVRLSLSWFTTDEECETVASALKEIACQVRG